MNRDHSHDRGDWAAHGFTGVALDLIAAGSLPAAWAKRWALDPLAPVLRDYRQIKAGGGTSNKQSTDHFDQEPHWITAGELDALTRGAALRFAEQVCIVAIE